MRVYKRGPVWWVSITKKEHGKNAMRVSTGHTEEWAAREAAENLLRGVLEHRRALAAVRIERAKQKAVTRSRGRCVYYIQRGDTGPVKIGVTEDVKARVRALQNGSPERLRLLVSEPGDERVEAARHAWFASYRIGGEWFSFEGTLKKFVSTLIEVQETNLSESVAA